MKVFLAGHDGMVGRAIRRKLEQSRDTGRQFDVVVRSRRELDLTDQTATAAFMQCERPDIVILAAARVGGILANKTFPAQFIYENLIIQCNVIHAAFEAGVSRLLQLGSSCIYPRNADQPMTEAALLSGPLELTNEPYAIAKIAGIKLCESYNRQYGVDYRSVMPTNLYGPFDNFHPETSHVLPALIARFTAAAEEGAEKVIVWGSGAPRREFLHVDDMADGCLFVLQLHKDLYISETQPQSSHINIGSGTDISISELAELVARATGFSGDIVFDATLPDGVKRKLMDSSRINNLGWHARISIEEGIESTVTWYRENRTIVRRK